MFISSVKAWVGTSFMGRWLNLLWDSQVKWLITQSRMDIHVIFQNYTYDKIMYKFTRKTSLTSPSINSSVTVREMQMVSDKPNTISPKRESKSHWSSTVAVMGSVGSTRPQGDHRGLSTVTAEAGGSWATYSRGRDTAREASWVSLLHRRVSALQRQMAGQL